MAQVRAAFGCCAERRSVRRSTSSSGTFTLGGGPPSDTLGRFVPRSRRVIGLFSTRPSSSQSSAFAQSASSMSCGQVPYRGHLRDALLRGLAGRCLTRGHLRDALLRGLAGRCLTRGHLRDALLRGLAGRCLTRGRLLLGRRRTKRDSSPGTLRCSRAARGSARFCVRTTEDREASRCGNEDGLVTRRPLNCDHATPDVGHDAASGRLVHLGAHHLNLVTDFWHWSLQTTLVGTRP